MSNDSKVTTLDAPGRAAAAEAKAVSRPIAGKSSGHDAQLSGKTLDVNIYASEQEYGNNAVEIGLNGVMYLVPRGQYETVPEELVGVLRDAVVTVTVPAKNGGGVVERQVPRYNFQTR